MLSYPLKVKISFCMLISFVLMWLVSGCHPQTTVMNPFNSMFPRCDRVQPGVDELSDRSVNCYQRGAETVTT